MTTFQAALALVAAGRAVVPLTCQATRYYGPDIAYIPIADAPEAACGWSGTPRGRTPGFARSPASPPALEPWMRRATRRGPLADVVGIDELRDMGRPPHPPVRQRGPRGNLHRPADAGERLAMFSHEREAS
ncbi:hypothetical protein GCM10010404_32150 [Nonomuraea africana]|uniref:Uncharacterized protein n=1 Tax=Nonomuraea africana TaxID=46171 RepID=A0ABR9KRH0_9ACTN|nr:hypothetical protein [Nonomuraea africana]MBE1564193.1 hypothetical protein [Nonomuraea africana]